jgi:hypothetical protein
MEVRDGALPNCGSMLTTDKAGDKEKKEVSEQDDRQGTGETLKYLSRHAASVYYSPFHFLGTHTRWNNRGICSNPSQVEDKEQSNPGAFKDNARSISVAPSKLDKNDSKDNGQAKSSKENQVRDDRKVHGHCLQQA